MKNKMYIVALLVFGLGTLLLLGTSYSLIIDNLVSKETYGFNVANFDVQFFDDTKITISGIPTSDSDGLKNSKEYTFTINNNSDYDINYRLDIIENSSFPMKDVIHYAYKINDSEYSDVITLGDNYTIKQNKVLKVNANDVFKIKIWLSEDADESYMNKAFEASIILLASQNEYKYASSVIEKLGNDNKDNLVKVDEDWRYSKKDSPNYVWFNCQNGFTKGEDYCEKWRIIGSFKNKTEKSREDYYSLKIISTKEYSEIAYNNEEANGNYDNSYINSYANGYYYDKLDEHTQSLILKARWNIGEVSSTNYQDVLKEEKEKTIYANIGLPNISDYLYLPNESYFDITNTIFLNKTNGTVNVLNQGIMKGINDLNFKFVPCVYLRGDVSITSGDGSVDNPYELGIKFPMNY